MNECLRQILACVAIWLTCWQMAPIAYGQEPKPAPQLNITVLEGQGAINNIRARNGHDIAVQVDDMGGQPVSGASVVFTLPSQGPSGTFANGEKTQIVNTDAQGKAVARGFVANKVAGKLEVRVNASFQGKTSSITVTQFNMAVQNEKSSSSGKWVAILIVAGAAGAAGAVLGTRGSSSPASTPPPPTPSVISITPGSGNVGAP